MNIFAFLICLTLITSYMFLVYDQHRYFYETVLIFKSGKIKKYKMESFLNYSIANYINSVTRKKVKKSSRNIDGYSIISWYVLDDGSSVVGVFIEVYYKGKLYGKGLANIVGGLEGEFKILSWQIT